MNDRYCHRCSSPAEGLCVAPTEFSCSFHLCAQRFPRFRRLTHRSASNPLPLSCVPLHCTLPQEMQTDPSIPSHTPSSSAGRSSAPLRAMFPFVVFADGWIENPITYSVDHIKPPDRAQGTPKTSTTAGSGWGLRVCSARRHGSATPHPIFGRRDGPVCTRRRRSRMVKPWEPEIDRRREGRMWDDR